MYQIFVMFLSAEGWTMHRLHKSRYQVSLAQCTQLSAHWAGIGGKVCS